MLRVFTFTLSCVLLLTTALVSFQPGSAQVTPAEIDVLVNGAEMPSSGGKYPHIAGYANTVHVASNPDRKAAYWSKLDSATSWPDRTILGDARGQADYASASVAVGANGFVAVVWIDRDTSSIYARCRAPGGEFGDRRTVGSASGFGVFVQPAVGSNGQVFAVWNSDGRFRYSVSNDGCNNWSGRSNISDKDAVGTAHIIAGQNGGVLVGYYSKGEVYAAEWNGNGFTSTRVDRGGNYFADPTVAIAGNGRYYIAWRGVSNGEVWYAERQPDGSWPNSRLASGGDTSGTVGISADQEGNLHVFWHNGGLQYAYKSVTGPWEGPRRVGSGGFNVVSAATVSDRVYGHAVYEVFTGGGVRTYYALTANQATLAPQGSLVINDDVVATKQQGVSVKFALTAGAADQYQLSNDNQTFSEYAALPDNKTVAWNMNAPSGTACEARSVYGRLRQSSRTDLVSEVLSDAIFLDPGVDVDVEARNPYLSINPTVYSDGELQQSTLGARNGDPRYTRMPYFFLEITGQVGECSGLKSYTVSDGQKTETVAITGNVAKPVLFPSLDVPEVNNLAITVTDGSDHQRAFQQTIYYDNVPPTVITGTMEVVDVNDTPIDDVDDIVVTLRFTNVQITDNVYGKHGEPYPFWGLFLANSPELINMQDAEALNALTWSPVPLSAIEQNNAGALNFEIEWSLFGGLDDEHWQGNEDFQIIGAVVDGAGNVSVLKVADVVTLREGFTLPTVYLPLISK